VLRVSPVLSSRLLFNLHCTNVRIRGAAGSTSWGEQENKVMPSFALTDLCSGLEGSNTACSVRLLPQLPRQRLYNRQNSQSNDTHGESYHGEVGISAPSVKDTELEQSLDRNSWEGIKAFE